VEIWKKLRPVRLVLRGHSKISSQNRRSDLDQIWLLKLSEATGIVDYFEDFTIEQQPKMA